MRLEATALIGMLLVRPDILFDKVNRVQQNIQKLEQFDKESAEHEGEHVLASRD